MNQTEYRTQLQSVFNLAALVRRIKISPVLEAMGHSEIAGAPFAPTANRKALTSLEQQMRIVQAALQFQQTINEITADPKYSQIGEKGR